jgi:hypothetical protein
MKLVVMVMGIQRNSASKSTHVIFNSTFGLAQHDPCQAQGKVSKLKGERDHLYF